MGTLLKGWRSSEFWITLAAGVITIGGPFIDSHVAAAASSSSLPLALLAAAYTVGRSWVKRRALELDAAKEAAAQAAAANAAAQRISAASARAGEAAGVPPLPTGGNVGTPAPAGATIGRE